ncbi:hypothetical protein DL767_003443 [Monosporascus sp. MG133]|nr:hypothetical protein DL767_003443 [Monosporascus sp. MG133]
MFATGINGAGRGGLVINVHHVREPRIQLRKPPTENTRAKAQTVYYPRITTNKTENDAPKYAQFVACWRLTEAHTVLKGLERHGDAVHRYDQGVEGIPQIYAVLYKGSRISGSVLSYGSMLLVPKQLISMFNG